VLRALPPLENSFSKNKKKLLCIKKTSTTRSSFLQAVMADSLLVVDGSSTELRTRGLEAVWPRVRVTSALLAFTASPRPCICTWQPYRACTVPVHAGSSFACFLFGVREKYYLKILFVS